MHTQGPGLGFRTTPAGRFEVQSHPYLFSKFEDSVETLPSTLLPPNVFDTVTLTFLVIPGQLFYRVIPVVPVAFDTFWCLRLNPVSHTTGKRSPAGAAASSPAPPAHTLGLVCLCDEIQMMDLWQE